MSDGLWLLVCLATGFAFSLVALIAGLDLGSWQYFVLLAAFAAGCICFPRRKND